jgi:hypothetical protein
MYKQPIAYSAMKLEIVHQRADPKLDSVFGKLKPKDLLVCIPAAYIRG